MNDIPMERPQEIDVKEAASLLAGPDAPVLLDVREGWELETASVKGAINIPLGTVPGRAGELAKDKPILVMCHHGGRSARATAWLRENGYAATNVAGGIDAWSREIDPSVPVY